MKHQYLNHPKQRHTLSYTRMSAEAKKPMPASLIALSPQTDGLVTGPGVPPGSSARLAQAGLKTAGWQEH